MVQMSLSYVALVYAAFTIGSLSGCVHSITFLEIFKKLYKKPRNLADKSFERDCKKEKH